MKYIEDYIQQRRKIFLAMQKEFGGFEERPGEKIVPHAYPLQYGSEDERDNAMRILLRSGIECRKFFSCIPTDEPRYKQKKRFPVAEHIAHTHLYVPCHQNMKIKDVKYISEIVTVIPGRVK